MNGERVRQKVTIVVHFVGWCAGAALVVTALIGIAAVDGGGHLPTVQDVEPANGTPTAEGTATATSSHRILGHRGGPDSSGSGENTLRAFRWLMARGIAIEGDVRQTSDGHMAMFHPASVRPDCSGSRATSIETMTFAQVRNLRCYATKQRVPTLRSVLAEMRQYPDITFSLELKHARSSSVLARRAMARKVIRIVARYGMRANVSYQEFDDRVIPSIRRLSPSARVEYLETKPSRLGVRRAVALGAATYSYDVRRASAEINRYAHSQGLSVTNWTCSLKQARRAFNLGADAVMGDDPVALIASL